MPIRAMGTVVHRKPPLPSRVPEEVMLAMVHAYGRNIMKPLCLIFSWPTVQDSIRFYREEGYIEATPDGGASLTEAGVERMERYKAGT